jgi:hypothetical protein
MFVVSVVCCQVKVSATDWSLVQRSPTDCGASLCVIKKPRKRGGESPLRGRENTTKMGCNDRKTNKHSICVVKSEVHNRFARICKITKYTKTYDPCLPPDSYLHSKNAVYTVTQNPYEHLSITFYLTNLLRFELQERRQRWYRYSNFYHKFRLFDVVFVLCWEFMNIPGGFSLVSNYMTSHFRRRPIEHSFSQRSFGNTNTLQEAESPVRNNCALCPQRYLNPTETLM